MKDITNIEHLYIISRWMYSIGEPIIDDATYNIIHQSLIANENLKKYTERSWSSDPCPSELLDLYGLSEYKYEVTLTEKTESIPSLVSWEEVERQYKHSKYPQTLSYKIDGFNASTHAYNSKVTSMRTRGRKSDAIEITNYIKHLPETINLPGEVRIVGELALSNKAFEELQSKVTKTLVSQRSSVRTALADAELAGLLEYITFDLRTSSGSLGINEKFRLLREMGFKTPQPRIVHDYHELVDAIQQMGKEREMYPYPTDGIVVASEDGQDLYAIRVGEWEEPVYESYIIGYEESYGPSRVGVKLLIKPVRLSNSTQKRISITNYKRIIDLDLLVGTPIAFKLTSQAVADIDIPATKALQEFHKANPSMCYNVMKSRNGWSDSELQI